MRISDWSSDVCSSDLDPTHQHALVDCLHGDLGGRSIAEVAQVEENAASGSYRGRGLVKSPSARIVVVSRGRSRREIASRLAIITIPDFEIVRAAHRRTHPFTPAGRRECNGCFTTCRSWGYP